MNETGNCNGGAARQAPQHAIGQAEALAMLQSAAGYCLAAGLRLRAGNLAGLGLVLIVDGAALEAGAFVLGGAAQAAPNLDAASAEPVKGGAA